jgi:hypothetical protein
MLVDCKVAEAILLRLDMTPRRRFNRAHPTARRRKVLALIESRVHNSGSAAPRLSSAPPRG